MAATVPAMSAAFLAGALRAFNGVLTDGKGLVTSWGYDAYGRPTSKTNAASAKVLTWAYDAAGRLTSRWSAAKGTTAYAYDRAANLTNVNYPASADIALAYDALGRLTNEVAAVLILPCGSSGGDGGARFRKPTEVAG